MKAIGKFLIVASALMLLGLWAMPAHADHQGRGGPGFSAGRAAGPGHGGRNHGGRQLHGGRHGHGHFSPSYGQGGFRGSSRYGLGGPSFGRSYDGGSGRSCYGSPGGNFGIYLPRFGLRLNF